MAVSWDGDKTQVHLNGVLAMTHSYGPGDTPLETGCDEGSRIGYYLDDAGDHVGSAALIRHVSIWSTALDPATQLEVAKGELPSQDLEAYYPLDEGGGTVALDVSGHGRHGTYIEGTEWPELTLDTGYYLGAQSACQPADVLGCSGDEATWADYCKDQDGDQGLVH